MRGLLVVHKLLRIHAGSTPAHAGIITAEAGKAVDVTEHPRACGDYWKLAISLYIAHGAPPRMRGLSSRPATTPFFPGSTPAHAGIINHSDPGNWFPQEHPRACGDYCTPG